jgi:hypothetical protein
MVGKTRLNWQELSRLAGGISGGVQEVVNGLENS